ncbi:MAG: RNA polymerase sigma factor, partial [Thermoleophilaceae bacterium]
MEASALPRRRAALLPRSRRLLGTFSDERLVDQIRRGNEAAFEVVFDRHHLAILSFCRHMLGSQHEAEDAVQQTFASAFAALSADDRDIRLKAWLYAIARNKSLSILRARREQPAELEEQPTAGLSHEVEQRADLRELLADLRTLPDDQREALVLFELGDLSHAEIAEVIGVEPMKVKALVFQARSALIENREARAIPCDEIREQLATATGGQLRRGPLRRHLKSCEGCSEYRDLVKKQRRAMAALLPVIPTAGLKAGVLGTLGIGGGVGGAGITTAAGGAIAGGSAVAGGGGIAEFASMGAAKLAVVAVVATGSVAGGGLAVERAIHHGSPKPPAKSEAAAAGDPGASGGAAG